MQGSWKERIHLGAERFRLSDLTSPHAIGTSTRNLEELYAASIGP